MDQVDARRHARALCALTREIYIATTETALRGQWPADPEVWVIVKVGPYPLARVLTTVDEALAAIKDG